MANKNCKWQLNVHVDRAVVVARLLLLLLLPRTCRAHAHSRCLAQLLSPRRILSYVACLVAQLINGFYFVFIFISVVVLVVVISVVVARLLLLICICDLFISGKSNLSPKAMLINHF